MDTANRKQNIAIAMNYAPYFNSISCSGKIVKDAVIHNIELLKALDSEVKVPIIGCIIRNDIPDYVGLQYLYLYEDHHRKQQLVEKDHVALPNRKRKSGDVDDEEDYIEEEEARKKKKKIPKPSLESLSEDEQENVHVAELDKKRVYAKFRQHDEDYTEEEDEDEDYIEEEEKHPKKIVKEKANRAREITLKPNPESLPEEIKRKITALNGSDIKWVYTKRLYGTDVASNNSRLSMPKKQIDMGFLREEEKELLSKKKGGVVPEIGVGLVGPAGEELRTSLKMWEMRKDNGRVSYVYNLVENWYRGIVVGCHLKKSELIQIWSFRVGQHLWFSLVRVPD